MGKLRIKKSTIYQLLKLFGYSKAPIRSIVTTLVLGISLGVAYEEMFGIGTWHSYHPDTEKLNVCFTPPSGCGGLIAQEISKANTSIYVQAYGLTSNAIINQLKSAHTRGVKVHVLLDGGNLSNNDSIYHELRSFGINTEIDKMSGIAHNKVMIIDQHKVITGSYNFTNAADTRNAENLLLIDDSDIAKLYLQNWFSRKHTIKN
jgi:phospholipase D